MPGTTYVDGRYVPHHAARVHIEDRGYQFADGVYEVIAVYNGRLVDGGPHLDRLDRSLAELAIPAPMARRALERVLDEVVRRNRLVHGSLYLQVTRGVARREHVYPDGLRAVLTVMPQRAAAPSRAATEQGYAVITLPDIRWKRCDIKTISLLANVLTKNRAVRSDAAEAWLLDDAGMVTEGASSNAWIVTRAGELVTHPPDAAILSGITRATLIRLAQELQIKVVERPFSLAEAKAAREAFYTSATAILRPVVRIDDAAVGDGAVGPIARRLADAYFDALEDGR